MGFIVMKEVLTIQIKAMGASGYFNVQASRCNFKIIQVQNIFGRKFLCGTPMKTI